MNHKLFSLQRRTSNFLIFLFAFLVIVVTMLVKITMLNSITKLENQYVQEHAGRLQKAFQGQLIQLDQIARDWAVWDDSYEYIVNHNKAFEKNNLQEFTYENLHLNMMVFADHAGAFVFAKGMDNGRLIPIYKDFREKMTKSGLLLNTDPKVMGHGILMLAEGPMLVASYPILPSDSNGPVRGNLIVGRFLDQGLVSEIAESLKLQVSVERLDENHASIFDGISEKDPIVVDSKNENLIVAYSLMKDIYQKPSLGLSISMDRDFSLVGRKSVFYLATSLVISGTAFLILIGLFLRKNILLRLKRLSQNVGQIGEEQSSLTRLPEEPMKDEISIVSDAINAMLGKKEIAEKALLEAHAELESKVQLRTAQLVKANQELANENRLRKQTQEEVERLAYYDHLTGLPNRLLLMNRLGQAIDLARRIERPIGILFMDLDGFKVVNDTMGHVQGDELLKAVAGRLLKLVRKSDTVARMGGDEFIVMTQNLRTVDHIQTIADKIVNAFRQPFDLNDQEVYVTASVGISIFPTDGETGEALIKNADLAMYKAKEKGNNQCVFCTKIMKENIEENMKLSNGLYRAVERNELEVYYQPQVNHSTRKIVGLEALLRWNHPELGLVAPGKFIHLAEQTGLIIPIGLWVLRTVCRQNKMWQDAGLPHIRVAVNLSIIQFQSPEIVNQIKEILVETNLDPRYLELEITESIAMRDTDFIIQVLKAFREIGVYISIDDFGTEFSSLKYLKLLPINRIKIPMPFIHGINVHEKDEAITKTIIVLAKNMGMEVIAEGVETEQQETFLSQRMCDEMQGFYYYKPMPAKEIEAILRKNQ